MVATIALDVANGPVGTIIEITGTDFTPAATVTFTFGGAPIVANDAPITVAGGGGFTAHITVPASLVGVKAIVADDGTVNDSEDFTVESQVVITESNITVGGTINFTGTGYGNAKAVSFTFNGVALTPVSPVTTNATGGFIGSAIVPEVPNGSRTLVATDADTNTDSDTVIVDAKIVLSPTSGGPGDTITIAGHGFAATEDITFTIEGDALTTDPASVSSDADGAFSADFDIPLTGYDGNAVTIVATDESTNTDSAELNVIISELAINTTFSRFNGRDLHHKSVNALGSIEKSAIVDVTFSATDVYQTGGMPVQFSDVGFNQVYLCKIIHQNIGRNMSFVVGASNNPDGGKIKIWGTDGNELADESTLVQSKSIRVQIRGI